MLARIRGKENPCKLLLGIWFSAALVENTTEVYKKTKNGTMVWLSNSPPGYIYPPKKQKFKKIYAPQYSPKLLQMATLYVYVYTL